LVFGLVDIINTNYIFIMAKQTVAVKRVVKNIARPGIHAKAKTSNLKTSKNYKKLSRGQG
jgi:hypothetical protein